MKSKLISIMVCFVIANLLLVASPVAIAKLPQSVTGQLWMEAIGGTYVENHPDDWLEETWTIGFGSFNLDIKNHHQHQTMCNLYLITSVNTDPTTTTINVKVNGTQIDDWTAVTTGEKIIVAGFEYPYHGIFQTGTWYNVTKIEMTLGPDESSTVLIDTSGNANVKIHFDGVGTDCSDNAIVFVPPSHDATSQIPEFPTVALPIAAILGLVFLFQHRKKKEE